MVNGQPLPLDRGRGQAQGMTNEEIARVARAAMRAYQQSIGDPVSPAWDDAPEWDRESALEGVRVAQSGATAADRHEAWRRRREAADWVPGPVKDEGARTHPNLVPYAELSLAQRRKDDLFGAIVGALS